MLLILFCTSTNVCSSKFLLPIIKIPPFLPINKENHLFPPFRGKCRRKECGRPAMGVWGDVRCKAFGRPDRGVQGEYGLGKESVQDDAEGVRRSTGACEGEVVAVY